MRKDSRLSRMLHVLVHMHHQTSPLTSDQIALMLHTNPVVVRRTMAILKAAGFVSSGKGHGGGWQLAMPLAQITLLDIHKALKEGSLFTLGLTDEHNECPIEQAVNTAIDDVLQAAEALVLERFSQVTLDQLAGDQPPLGMPG
ncbi:RrF2 family transcriptional regulator [Thalassolituus sp. LLYu03]|uniref:RrF2 family transcriptional regulator n=1 Tax=Thalassolituus sp. LLYu03 TaxID=3421656 RepID=UPI003D28D0CD